MITFKRRLTLLCFVIALVCILYVAYKQLIDPSLTRFAAMRREWPALALSGVAFGVYSYLENTHE